MKIITKRYCFDLESPTFKIPVVTQYFLFGWKIWTSKVKWIYEHDLQDELKKIVGNEKH